MGRCSSYHVASMGPEPDGMSSVASTALPVFHIEINPPNDQQALTVESFAIV